MNPVNQVVNTEASPILPVKRKRGRPRKDPSEKRVQKARTRAAYVPLSFGQLNSNHPPQLEPFNDVAEGMIGQRVTGIVEATFDAGYLLAVRIGNSNTTLRGVVFKPGHSAPVTAENDVAPHVPMIRRHDIPFPTGGQSSSRRHKRRAKGNDMQLVTYTGDVSPPPNQVLSTAPSKGDYVLAPSVPPVGARGTVVPVVLQPVNLSNGLSTNQPAPHLKALKAQPLAVHPPNGSTSHAPKSQMSSLATPMGSGNEDDSFKQATPDVRAKPLKSNDVQPQGELSANQDGDDKAESDIADMNEPLFVEPLQTRHSGHPFQFAAVSGPMEHNVTGRMSELLQAVQQNSSENQARFASGTFSAGSK